MNESAYKKNQYLSIKVLAYLGNIKPTHKQIAFMNSLLFSIFIEHELLPESELTEREIGCLRLAAMGKTANEIATILNITKLTVETHHKRIKQKLRVENIAHAVFKGFQLGYVRPMFD